MKKVCGILEGIIMVLLALVAAVLLLPKLFGVQTLAVISGSMEPGIPVGSIVFTQEVGEPEKLEEGDVITYVLGSGTYVTHRITENHIEKQEVITKGDANEAEDASPVSYTQILGKCLFHLPLLGYISIYVKTPIGIAVICGIIILLILLNFLPEIFEKEEKEEKTAKEK